MTHMAAAVMNLDLCAKVLQHTPGEKESPSLLLLLGARILFSSKEQQAVYLEFTYLRLNASTHTQIAYIM